MYRGGIHGKAGSWFHLRGASGYENIVELEGTGLSPTSWETIQIRPPLPAWA